MVLMRIDGRDTWNGYLRQQCSKHNNDPSFVATPCAAGIGNCLSRSILYLTRAIGLQRMHALASFVHDKVKAFPKLCMHRACADMMVSGADVVDERIVELWTRNNESFKTWPGTHTILTCTLACSLHCKSMFRWQCWTACSAEQREVPNIIGTLECIYV